MTSVLADSCREVSSPMAPGVDVSIRLSAETWERIEEWPWARDLVESVWARLDTLERDGHDPGTVAALRFVLEHHQPTSTGRCRACRPGGCQHLWRRRPWPCTVWMQIHYELVGSFAGCGHHRRQP